MFIRCGKKRKWLGSTRAWDTPSPVFCKNVIRWELGDGVCKRCDSKGDRSEERLKVGMLNGLKVSEEEEEVGVRFGARAADGSEKQV
jgi:hypothetical protein